MRENPPLCSRRYDPALADALDGVQVVLFRRLVGRGLRLPDVDADRDRAVGVGEAVPDEVGAVVVEPHPVDEGAVLGEPVQSGPRVAGLGLGGDAADLDVAEAERRQRGRDLGVLVEAGGDADGVPERPPERVDPQPAIDDGVVVGQHRLDARVLDGPQEPVDRPVGGLGVQPEQQRFRQRVGPHLACGARRDL